MKPKIVFAAVTAMSVFLATGCAGSSTTEPIATEYPTEDVTLTMWWWGEQEAPGAQEFVDQAIEAYEAEHQNVTIDAVLQTTDGLVPSFQTAAQSQTGPDVAFFWGGTNALTPAWNDSLTPISDYIPESEYSHYLNSSEETTGDTVWTAPWYVQPSFPLLIRNDVLAEYGQDLPETWTDLMSVCSALSDEGVTTIAGGVKDGWFGGWLYSMLGAQDLSSEKDVIAASAGEQSFADAPHSTWWDRLEESREAGCWNDDINSLELYQAQQRFVDGEAAMTVTAGTDALNFVAEAGGAENVTVMAIPADTEGQYAGKLGSTSQTLGITSWTEIPQVAADFISFLHTTEQLKAWYEATGTMPADDRFDIAQVTDPAAQQLFTLAADGAPYLENYIPPQLDSDAVFKNVQLVLQGSMTAAEAAADMQAVAEQIRKSDRDLVTNYTEWMK